MEQKNIFELIDKFEQSRLTKLEIKDGDFSLKLENQSQQAAPVIQTPVAAAAQTEKPQAAASAPASGLIPIKAPLVGVFYAAPAPDAEPFVKIGDKVEKGQTVCLVEAMKMMNELKSPADGIIKSIKGINGELVEFDQILFEVEPC